MSLEELNIDDYRKIKLLVDNQSTIDLSNHPTSHGRSKHIEKIYHFLRDQVSKVRFEEVNCNAKHVRSELGRVLWLIQFALRIYLSEYISFC